MVQKAGKSLTTPLMKLASTFQCIAARTPPSTLHIHMYCGCLVQPDPLIPPHRHASESLQDPSELNPSKGYGFVEFAHHGQALAALRHLNNNPSFSGQARSEGAAKGESSRLIVEFSVENHAKLKLQQVRNGFEVGLFCLIPCDYAPCCFGFRVYHQRFSHHYCYVF